MSCINKIEVAFSDVTMTEKEYIKVYTIVYFVYGCGPGGFEVQWSEGWWFDPLAPAVCVSKCLLARY